MFVTCCRDCGGVSRLYGGRYFTQQYQKCFERTKQFVTNRHSKVICCDPIEEIRNNNLKASKLPSSLLQTIQVDELKDELRNTLEIAIRKAKGKGELLLTEDEKRILDELEVCIAT